MRSCPCSARANTVTKQVRRAVRSYHFAYLRAICAHELQAHVAGIVSTVGGLLSPGYQQTARQQRHA